MTEHGIAMAWLNIRFCLTQDKSEEKIINYIQQMLKQYEDLRNS